MCRLAISTNGFTVIYNKHDYEAESKTYYDTGSQALACTSNACESVDLTKEN